MIEEAFLDVWSSGEIWSILIKVLIGLAFSGIAGLCGTLIVRIITNCKESKIYKYATTLVEAAEQKYPNEGTKMGPQKMDYVMSQLVIRFPHIKDNRYLYNIVEQSVFKFNEKRQQQKQIEEFERKHGKGSYKLTEREIRKKQKEQKVEEKINTTTQISTSDQTTDTKKSSGLKSF